MQKNHIFFIGAALIAIGLIQPDFLDSLNPFGGPKISNTQITEAPSDAGLLEKAKAIINILESSNPEDKQSDCAKLSSLYADMATLISLDNDNPIIKDTISIREANILCGRMLKINLQDKYPNLAEKTEELVLYSIGNDDVVLDSVLRQKAVEAFKSLSWAFYKGAR